MQARQLRDMDEDELLKHLATVRQDLLGLRFALATGELDNTARVARVRRDVARALTVTRERERAARQG